MIYDKETAKNRTFLTKKTRNFFENKGFLEVETPILTPIPGMEPHLDPFETTFKNPQTEIPLYLNTSPELQMKKLLGTGFEKIFNITKVFRNGEMGGGRHNPEFTMIEWYRYNANYNDLKEDCENLLINLAGKKITYQNEKIDLSKPWDKKSTHELFMEYCDIDLLKNKSYEKLKKTAENKGHTTSACTSWDDIFFKIFLNDIEPNLGKTKPIFVYDYPSSQAALAKKKEENPFFAERFELYIAGIEIANAFSELIDAKEQNARLKYEQKIRKTLKKTIFDIDEEFLLSLESIRKPSAGIALGLDRLFMLLLDKKTIEELLLFPLTKMINSLKNANNNRHKTRNRNLIQKPTMARSSSPIRKSRKGLRIHQNQTQKS